MDRSQLFRIGVLTFGFAILTVATTAQADEPDKPRGQQPILRFTAEEGEGQEGIVVQIGGPSEYWLGVAVEPLAEEDRAEAKLPEGQGLEIERVMADSPADTAGLREDDSVLSVDGKGIASLADLQKLVQESAGKPLSFELLRDGKKTTVEATPVKRSEAQRIVIAEEREEEERGERKPMVIELPRWMERTKAEADQQRAGQPAQWQPLPGNPAWTFQAAPFPEDLNVSMKKKGSKPARIKVSRGILSWTVNENELGKLPEDIRGYVLRMMPGPAAPPVAFAIPGQQRMMMNIPQPGRAFLPEKPIGPRAVQPGAANAHLMKMPSPAEQVQREMQELKHQLQELHEQIEALRSKQ